MGNTAHVNGLPYSQGVQAEILEIIYFVVVERGEAPNPSLDRHTCKIE